jgi:hypothetical protein
MTKEFETLKEMCNFVLQQAKNSECAYEIGKNEDGETCLYQKILVGKVKDDAGK